MPHVLPCVASLPCSLPCSLSCVVTLRGDAARHMCHGRVLASILHMSRVFSFFLVSWHLLFHLHPPPKKQQQQQQHNKLAIGPVLQTVGWSRCKHGLGLKLQREAGRVAGCQLGVQWVFPPAQIFFWACAGVANSLSGELGPGRVGFWGGVRMRGQDKR